MKHWNIIKKAAVCYERAIAIDPNYADANNNLSIIFKEFREFQKAIKIDNHNVFANMHKNFE